MYTCSDRYLLSLPQMNRIISAQSKASMYTPVIKVKDDGALYPIFDMADLTGHLRCVAISSQAPVAELKTASDLGTMVRIISNQDRNQRFIESFNKLPQSKLNPVTLDSSGVKARLRIMLCVNASASCAAAFKLLQPLLKRGVDQLHLVTFVQDMKDSPTAYRNLDSFVPDDLFVEVQRNVVLMEGDNALDLKEDIDGYADRIKATIIVLGSNMIGREKDKVGSITGKYLSKGLKHTTLLVNEHQQLEDAWVEVEVAAAITYSCATMVGLVCKMFRPSTDDVTLIRVLQSEAQPQEADQALLRNVADQFFTLGFKTASELKMGKTWKKLLEVVTQKKAEVLCLQMPDALAMPDGVKNIIANSPCAILLVKGERRKAGC
mmetsp:Transcript_30200/g.36679  ORF Transcript_30200/g.36679 Transcript_30200/m.36679 type:complete len:378 (+) Transcript_30200:2-1135(+)